MKMLALWAITKPEQNNNYLTQLLNIPQITSQKEQRLAITSKNKFTIDKKDDELQINGKSGIEIQDPEGYTKFYTTFIKTKDGKVSTIFSDDVSDIWGIASKIEFRIRAPINDNQYLRFSLNSSGFKSFSGVMHSSLYELHDNVPDPANIFDQSQNTYEFNYSGIFNKSNLLAVSIGARTNYEGELTFTSYTIIEFIKKISSGRIFGIYVIQPIQNKNYTCLYTQCKVSCLKMVTEYPSNKLSVVISTSILSFLNFRYRERFDINFILFGDINLNKDWNLSCGFSIKIADSYLYIYLDNNKSIAFCMIIKSNIKVASELKAAKGRIEDV